MIVDVVLVLVLLAYALNGLRQGLVVSALSLTGFLGAGALAMWALPRVLERWTTSTADDPQRTVVLLVGVLLAATAGQAVGTAVGARLRARVTWRPARAVDAVLGAVASTAAVAVLVWFVAGALRSGPWEPVSRALGSSRVVAGIDSAVPAQTGRLFAGFRGVLDAQGFPKVFEGFGRERILPAAPPDPGVGLAPGVRAAAEGVVKVTGTATACERGQEGSGWVVARERVVTNAHVVAGVRFPRVRARGSGPSYAGRVVVFDPRRDLAVIAVPGLPADPLPLGHDLARGRQAVVAGFPLDGPYRLDAARVRDVLRARGEDIYGSGGTVRRVYSLYARVQPGNSGGPLLSTGGEVVGVVFAKSLDDPRTGYALTLDEAAPVLDAARGADRRVATGGCAAG